MQTSETRSKTVIELYDKLKQWRQTITEVWQDELGGWVPLQETKITSTVLFHQRLMLEYFYHDCVVSLEKSCRSQDALYPRGSARASLPFPQKNTLNQLASDALESARSMCLLTQQIDVESYAPNWLVIYYPLTAIITLFSHVAMNPLSKTAMADIALINCVLGLFGRIEYMSSGSILLTNSSEFAKIAASLIHKAKSSETSENNTLSQHAVPAQPQNQQQGGTDEFHNAADPGGNHLDNATADSPFFQTQPGNAIDDMSELVPCMADQFQTLNWLDWNFLQNDIMIAR